MKHPSMRSAPKVSDAKALCQKFGARAVIVIAVDEGAFKAASYGETKVECAQTAYTLDCIVDHLRAGRIPVWEDRP